MLPTWHNLTSALFWSCRMCLAACLQSQRTQNTSTQIHRVSQVIPLFPVECRRISHKHCLAVTSRFALAIANFSDIQTDWLVPLHPPEWSTSFWQQVFYWICPGSCNQQIEDWSGAPWLVFSILRMSWMENEQHGHVIWVSLQPETLKVQVGPSVWPSVLVDSIAG